MNASIYKTNSLFQTLDLSFLRHFYAVAVFGGFSKASRATGISQPALSLGLQKLEKSLGVKLIDRGAREFSLSRDGVALLSFCQRMETGLDSVVSTMGGGVLKVRKLLKIGSALSIGLGPLAPLCLAAAQDERPMELDLTTQNTYKLLSDVLAGNLDAAIVPDDVVESGISFLTIKADRICFVVGKALLTPFRRSPWKDAMASVPLITYPRETPMRATIDKICLQHQIQSKTVISANSMDAIQSLVTQGVGAAFVLRSLVDRTLFEIRAPFKLPRSGIAIATRAGAQGDAIARLLRAWVRI